uniref:Ig-like domain-containing protein n=1 Tax=Hucho hucho TaxID=62062 RepID=A0A4W5JSF4_9TELE
MTLGCTYTPEPSDTGELDIEWSGVSPDTTQKGQLVSGIDYIHGNRALTKGLDFAAGDPSLDDVSLSITSLSPAYSAMSKVSLVMMSETGITFQPGRGEAVGEAVSLHCKSSQGSSPLNYRKMYLFIFKPCDPSDSVTGELLISNHSESFVGIYMCEVTNSLGNERCRINSEGVTAEGLVMGTLMGFLLLIIIMAILIWLLIYKCDAISGMEEHTVFILQMEDVPAPESRPQSQCTGQGTSLHPGLIPSTSTEYTPVKYDSRYGYVV